MKHPYYKRNKQIYNEAKTKCCICGETAKCCLEFHHLRDKHFNISHSLKWVTTEALILELRKTVCICRNCHAKLHNGLIKYENNKE